MGLNDNLKITCPICNRELEYKPKKVIKNGFIVISDGFKCECDWESKQ